MLQYVQSMLYKLGVSTYVLHFYLHITVCTVAAMSVVLSNLLHSPLVAFVMNWLVLLLLLQIRLGQSTSCPSTTTTTEETKPLYLLTLIPFPNQEDGSHLDNGIDALSGARIAQGEINGRTDLLPGYHIELIVENIESCSYIEANIGLSNLVKYTVSQPCRPVVAVAGLLCSSHTSVLSPVAGHVGYDLIQLAVANSPIFQTQHHHFPHLWRLLGSATAYIDTIIAIMDQFNWNRIGIAYDSGSVFYTESANYLNQQLRVRSKSVVFFSEIRGTNILYFESVISGIKINGTTVLVVMLNIAQTSKLLEMALVEDLVYPRYIWIHVEKILSYFLDVSHIPLFNATRGHILLHTLTELHNGSSTLVSGETYKNFQKMFLAELKVVKEMFNISEFQFSFTFGSHVYDEVWALALALDKSLSVLENRNLSIDGFTIGQRAITNVIEESLANLSFQGAGGRVKFNSYRSVSTPVEVYWVLENGTNKFIGEFNPEDSKSFYVNIQSSDLPNDTPPEMFISIPLYVAILLYIITIAVTVFTSLQLILYLCYRHKKIIKASSPYISLLMFAGCYLLCVAAAIKVTYGTFKLHEESFRKLVLTNIIAVLNGFSLILVTLFIKLLRVYRIFFSRLEKDLGRYWHNCPLLITVLCLTVLPNVLVLPLIAVDSPSYSKKLLFNREHGITEMHVHIELKTLSYFVSGGLIACYVTIFSFITVYLSIRTRKIKIRSFKDTKKLNLFIYVFTFTVTFTVPLYILFLLKEDEPAANIVFVVGLLVVSTAGQVILFLPKVLLAVLSSCS